MTTRRFCHIASTCLALFALVPRVDATHAGSLVLQGVFAVVGSIIVFMVGCDLYKPTITVPRKEI